MFRPTAFIAQEWAYYILVGERVITDLNSGERVTLQVPAETRTLVVHCPKAMGGYEASRIDYDFRANAAAYFVLSSRPECVNIQPVDAKAAAALMRQTRERAARPLAYDPAPRATELAPASAPGVPVASAASNPAAGPAASVAAATAAWVDAFNSRDPTRISALYDAEAVLSDTTESKPRIGAAAIADYYRSASQRPTQRVALGERNIRVFGDTAILHSRYRQTARLDGADLSHTFVLTDVWVRRNARWQIVHRHSTIDPTAD